MKNYRKSAKLSLFVTYVFMAALLLCVIFLPMVVTWYVEVRGRDQTLPTTIMLTCYPLVPFAAIVLLSLRRLLINLLSGLVIGEQNIKMLKRISICCLAAGLILIFVGHRYMPFYIAGIAAAACSLIVSVIQNLFEALLQAQNEE